MICPQDIRKQMANYQIIDLDFAYIAPHIESWWNNRDYQLNNHILKFQLANLIVSKMQCEHVVCFEALGRDNIAGISIKNIFNKDDPILSLIVHEALSDLFHLSDILYPYEQHKFLYLQPTGDTYKNWGGGSGEIDPHSDDLYEDIDTALLALTVCRDHYSQPTLVYFHSDIIDILTDDELILLANMEAEFISGKNVQIQKSRKRQVMTKDTQYGYQIAFDFRIDKTIGARMSVINPDEQQVLDKIKNNLHKIQVHQINSKTGTFTILDNYKALHARSKLEYNEEQMQQFTSQITAYNTPRLLYRSKGYRNTISLKHFDCA
jgi:hypothetical protein